MGDDLPAVRDTVGPEVEAEPVARGGGPCEGPRRARDHAHDPAAAQGAREAGAMSVPVGACSTIMGGAPGAAQRHGAAGRKTLHGALRGVAISVSGREMAAARSVTGRPGAAAGARLAVSSVKLTRWRLWHPPVPVLPR